MSGPVVLVTGATSHLGQAVVKRLATAGYRVAAADTCPGATSKVAEENNKAGGHVQSISVNILQKEHREQLVNNVVSEMGGLSHLVMVPPTNTVKGDIINTSPCAFDSVFNQYVTTPFRLIQRAMPEIAKEKGSVVLFSSMAGYSPFVDVGVWSVAQSSVLSMTKALATSAASHSVRVNSVCLGMVERDGSGAVWDADPKEGEPNIREGLKNMIPMGRMGHATDAASLVQFLVSDRARYITGENCGLSGGVSWRL